MHANDIFFSNRTVQLELPHKGYQYFQKLEKSGFAGLTDQTFLACIQTMSAVPELAQYLHKKFGFHYILSGKFTSDPIEARFGWYRHVNGGNFFISLKQLLEAEKKIRRLSLLQQYGLLAASQLHLNDDIPFTKMDQNPNPKSFEVTWLITFFAEVAVDDLSGNDANTAFYVCGYIARSICRHRRCTSGKALLVKSDKPPVLPLCDAEDHIRLFETANRGGLAQPTEFCFAATTLAVQYYLSLLSCDEAKSKLFACRNQRSAFVQAILTVARKRALNQICTLGHNFVIVQTAFNCFAKNEQKRLNAPKRDDPGPMS